MAGMRMKGDDDGFAIYAAGFLLHQLNNLLVAGMNTIKCTNGYNGIFKNGQVLNIVMYFHIKRVQN